MMYPKTEYQFRHNKHVVHKMSYSFSPTILGNNADPDQLDQDL